MPTAEAPGKLKNRDDKKLVNTEKEKVRALHCTVELNLPRHLMERSCFAAAADSVPASERRLRAAVQSLCGAGLLCGPLPVPQSVRGPGYHGRCAHAHWRLSLQVQQLPGIPVALCWSMLSTRGEMSLIRKDHATSGHMTRVVTSCAIC